MTDPMVITMTLAIAREILEEVDWSVEAEFTEDQQNAVHAVGKLYLAGDISRDEAAAILHVHPDKLPVPVEHARPS